MKKYLQILIFTLITQFCFSQTLEIFDIYPTASLGSFPLNMFVYNNHIFFQAYHPDSDEDLWYSDGTMAGTKLFKDLNPEGMSLPGHFINFNGSMIFTAWSYEYHKYVLWISNGTENSTHIISDVEVKSTFDYLEDNKVILNNLLYFYGNESLFVTDGTDIGTQLIKNNMPEDIIRFNNSLFFSAFDAYNDRELWISDGTVQGTSRLLDIDPEGSSVPMELTVWGSHFYFNADDGTHDRQLWKSDGTEEGTIMLTDYFTESNQKYPTQFVEFDDELYFVAGTAETTKSIWKTDGTEEGTKYVYGKPAEEYFNPGNMKVYNGKLYFSAYDPEHGTELWVTDGTEEGTYLFYDVYSGDKSSDPKPQIIYHNKLYFVAKDNQGSILWETDGTLEGTKKILPANALQNDIKVQKYKSVAILNGSLFFSAELTEEGFELWKLTTIAGVEEEKKDLSLDISPNPANNFINLNSMNKMEEIQIFDLLGNQINSYKPANNINIANLNSGSYILQVKTNKGFVRKKFIKID